MYLVTEYSSKDRYPKVVLDTDDLTKVQLYLARLSPEEAIRAKVYQERGYSYQPPMVVIDELVKTEKIDER
jgi:hypothetical protein